MTETFFIHMEDFFLFFNHMEDYNFQLLMLDIVVQKHPTFPHLSIWQ